MTILASQVVDVVRDLHPAFTPEDFPAKLLRRALERAQHQLVSQIVRVRPSALAVTAQLTALPLATFANGIALPAGRLYVREVIAQLASDATFTGSVPVNLVAPTTVYTPPSFPSAAIDGNTLVLGGVAQDWTSYASVTVKYIATPTLPLDATALVLPDDAMDACVQAVAAFAALRAVGLPGPIDIDPVEYQQLASDAASAFLTRITNQGKAEALRILEVW
jgi:hypothetical protein